MVQTSDWKWLLLFMLYSTFGIWAREKVYGSGSGRFQYKVYIRNRIGRMRRIIYGRDASENI